MSKAKQTQAAVVKSNVAPVAPVANNDAPANNTPPAASIETNTPPVAPVVTNSFLNKLGFAPELPKSAMKVEDKLALMRKGFVENATKHITALKGEKVEGRGDKAFIPTWYKELPDGSFRLVLKNGHVVFREDNTAKNSPRLSITAKTKEAAVEVLTAAVKGCNDGDLDEIFKNTVRAAKGDKAKAAEAKAAETAPAALAPDAPK